MRSWQTIWIRWGVRGEGGRGGPGGRETRIGREGGREGGREEG